MTGSGLVRCLTCSVLFPPGDDGLAIAHGGCAGSRPPTTREERMVVLRSDALGTPTVWCDPEIADLVGALDRAGLRPICSCCGHGHRPGRIALADGRELIVAKDFGEANAVDAVFPYDINGELRREPMRQPDDESPLGPRYRVLGMIISERERRASRLGSEAYDDTLSTGELVHSARRVLDGSTVVEHSRLIEAAALLVAELERLERAGLIPSGERS